MATTNSSSTPDSLAAEIAQLGETIKNLKTQNAPKTDIQPHVDKLVKLKASLADIIKASSKNKFDRAGLESLLLKRFFYAPSFAIYGSEWSVFFFHFLFF
jgi:glycyl-tRNA synthetase